MGTFAYTYTVAYQNNAYLGPPQGPFTETLDDGEADTSFEAGDTVTTLGANYTYAGTFAIDGVDWPAFTFASDPQFVVVFMDQEPVSPPATFTANGATFDGACFAPDTNILTETGEVHVQDLQVGDMLITAKGTATSVRWIGVVSRPTAIAGRAMAAVRIRAGAFGHGVPYSDLTVTADHEMILDGLVITAGALVNGETITLVPTAELPNRLTYYHIETENHDIILANGAPAETFIDYVGRQSFSNYREYVDLYGEDRTINEMAYPRISAARLVPQAIRGRLCIAEMHAA